MTPHSDQSLTLNAINESSRHTAAQLISYEYFVDNKLWLLLGIVILLVLLAGLVYVIFYMRKRDAHERNAAQDVGNDIDDGRTQDMVQIPAKYREVFVQTMEEDLGILNQALDEARVRAVMSMLHRMHGALAAVGLTELAERCELLGKEGRLRGLDDDLERQIAELARDLMRVIRWQQTI